MRALPIAAAAVLALATPSIVFAQDAADIARSDAESSLSQLSEKLSDPAFQDQTAVLAQVLLGTVLELPIGPMAEALDKATGGQGPDIDPDARVRDLAPEADDLPERLSDELPRAMSTMSGMAEGLELMLPALRDMAERMKGALDEARVR